MRVFRIVILLLLAALSIGGWMIWRSGWRPRLSGEAPFVEYRVTQSDAHGRTERLLAIDYAGQAILRQTPSGPAGTRTQLTCEELHDLPAAMKEEWVKLRASYGQERAGNSSQAAIVYRWGAFEKRVLWWNPPSSPKPPDGWDRVTIKLDEIERRAEEAPREAASMEDVVFEYGRRSSGYVGTYITVLSIHKSGWAVLMKIRPGPYVPQASRVELGPGELGQVLRTIEEARFKDFQPCYGKYAPVNPQDAWMVYRWEGKEKEVEWMSAPADPKPPPGWSRIAEILDPIWTRAEKELADALATMSRQNGEPTAF